MPLGLLLYILIFVKESCLSFTKFYFVSLFHFTTHFTAEKCLPSGFLCMSLLLSRSPLRAYWFLLCFSPFTIHYFTIHFTTSTCIYPFGLRSFPCSRLPHSQESLHFCCLFIYPSKFYEYLLFVSVNALPFHSVGDSIQPLGYIQ